MKKLFYKIIRSIQAWLNKKFPTPEMEATRLRRIRETLQRLRGKLLLRRMQNAMHYGLNDTAGVGQPKPTWLTSTNWWKRPEQEKCKHLKGGRYANPKHQIDYAVRTHTFIGGSTTVKCMLCGTEWSDKNGNLKDGLALAERSTNTRSSSEIPVEFLVRRK